MRIQLHCPPPTCAKVAEGCVATFRVASACATVVAVASTSPARRAACSRATSRAPAAIGPYSQAIIAQGKFLFISGQLGMNADGSLAGDTIEAQTRQVIMNLRMILDAAGIWR